MKTKAQYKVRNWNAYDAALKQRGSITFWVNEEIVDPGNDTLTYTINLNTPSGKPVSVNYTTADGTATVGTDYTPSNGIISFAPGETSKTITVQVLGDAIDEFDETFKINLSDATKAYELKGCNFYIQDDKLTG
ncbi:hypothetical protein NSTCB13_06432 [Nostoc sp. DSM 114160]|jgi:hypothetical protein